MTDRPGPLRHCLTWACEPAAWCCRVASAAVLLAIALSLPAGLLAAEAAPSVAASEPAASPPAFSAEQQQFFTNEVLPILQANCYKCHGEHERKGNLSLWGRAGALRGGDLGPAIDLANPTESRLLKAIGYADDTLQMPPTGKLAPTQVATLTRWIEQGLPWSTEHDHPDTAPAVHEVADPANSKWWAYQPLANVPVPALDHDVHGTPVSNPIDKFLLHRLNAEGLRPVGPADRIALCRRAYYDLIGLPPSDSELKAFVNDPSPGAFEALIDRLLASPHYGEKWGRHWLDVVHYAETNGYERDGPKPQAWRYRDYVVRSFNADKPYDQFIREQLAGDELVNADEAAHGPLDDARFNPDPIIATGFFRLGTWDDEPADPLQARADELDDIVATSGQVFLAMTLNCARCHDHKVDPIAQADYYSMVAFFQDVPGYSDSRDVSSRFNLTDITKPSIRAVYEEDLRQRTARLEELSKQMFDLEQIGIRKMPAEDQRASEGLDRQRVIDRKLRDFLDSDQNTQYEALKAQRVALEALPQPTRELALSVNHCTVPPIETHVQIRGNPHAEGALVGPAYPRVLKTPAPVLPEAGPLGRTAGRRMLLADWIASRDNPLTGRVIVNRIWQYHFGRGLVPTPNDFGGLGELPSHPELLDWLAADFMDQGWTFKRMHKLIMLSQAYQRASTPDDANLLRDPANRLLWRFNMRRLTAEEVRDTILEVTASLDHALGGPSVYPRIPAAVLAGQSVPGSGWHTSPDEVANRRSIYVHVKRSLLVPILGLYDAADTDTSCPVRYVTTVPTQALGLLNSEFANEQAQKLAERLQRFAPDSTARQVAEAVRLTTAREASPEDIQADVELISRLVEKGLSPAQAMQQFCLLCLNLNEFVYLD